MERMRHTCHVLFCAEVRHLLSSTVGCQVEEQQERSRSRERKRGQPSAQVVSVRLSIASDTPPLIASANLHTLGSRSCTQWHTVCCIDQLGG
jgi:hypothetical protein